MNPRTVMWSMPVAEGQKTKVRALISTWCAAGSAPPKFAQIVVTSSPTSQYQVSSEPSGSNESGVTSGCSTPPSVSDSYIDLPSRYTSPVCQVLTRSKNQSPPMRSTYGLRVPNRAFGTWATQTRPSAPGWGCQSVTTSAPEIVTGSKYPSGPTAAWYVIGASAVPPRGGFTHSRYTPACTATVSPGMAACAARLMVRNGASAEPSARSEPVVATCRMFTTTPFVDHWVVRW
ncbi:MAG: hypothetical protein NVV70_03630 [Cellulomonas sp.]|nr:hypothetical protein [Cellulomonas sp.]MCR6647258.1 hypothetical protein [Cellulomonas sp.]